MSTLTRIRPNTRLYDKLRGLERIVQLVEPHGSLVHLTLRDPKTGAVSRDPFTLAMVERRFEVLEAESSAFRGDAQVVSLVAEAHRLAHSYLFNPIFAIETSLIDPLPHQLLAVYDHLLKQPHLRFLLADDAGAGKTIMAGLYIREMLLRRLLRRILIVPPAGLVGNWERELRHLFRLNFRKDVVGPAASGDNPFTDPRNDLVIVSVDTARQERVRAFLREAPPYDLVIFDEAHKLSARRNADLTPDPSKRYETAEELAARATHVLLLTATPHMGKDDPYFFLWKLLDPTQFSTPEALRRASAALKSRHLLRRMKEEMVRFDGTDLYPPRRSQTAQYPFNPAEQALYDATTAYVTEHYAKTIHGNRSSVGLALSVIQRRLASSTWALLRSLERRVEKLSETLKQLQEGTLTTEQLAAQQQQLPTVDLRAEKTGDEESTDGDQEEAEVYDQSLSGATTARTVDELRHELAEVRALVNLAQAAYDAKRESKFERLQAALKDFPETKVLIFTEHRDTLDFIVSRLEGIGFAGRVATIHGAMDYRQREEQIERFRSDECPYMVATDAAGEGINLQFCWLLVNYDIPWNPARLEQRMGRVHRYKQTHDVLLISMVAKDSREDVVLQTLLDKLDLIRERLGNDKVFDLISERYDNISLSDLIFRATVGGETDAVAREVASTWTPEEAAKMLAERERRIELSEVRSLLEALKRRRESAEERRMMPAYVRRYFAESAPLIGLTIDGDLNGIFSLVEVPESFRRALIAYPEELRNKLTFDREMAMPANAVRPQAIYLHPGEPVFEAAVTLFLGRFESEAARGASFYDAAASEPYLFTLAKVPVVRDIVDEEGRETGDREVLAEEMIGIHSFADGRLTACPAHHLLTLWPANADEIADWPEELLGQSDNITAVEGFVLEQYGVPLQQRLQDELNERLPDREKQLVQSFNLRQVEAFEQRRRLKDDVAKGVPAAQSKLRVLETELADLEMRRDRTVAALYRDVELVALGPVTVYARALVLPLPPDEAERRRDVEAERIALQRVIAYEQTFGAEIADVSNPNEANGFDLRSTRPDGSVRFIEVKGRSGVAAVEMTENEWAQAANHRDRYWLYTVYHCDGSPQLHRVQDPFGKLLAKGGGVIIPAAQLVAAATQE